MARMLCIPALALAAVLEVTKRCAKTRASRDWCGYWQGNKRDAERLVS